MTERHFAFNSFELRQGWGEFAWDAPQIAAVLSAIDVVYGKCDR